MAEVEVRIGGRRYELACRPGDEDRLRTLGQMVDAKASEAARSMGGLTEVRQLLLAALLLADSLHEEQAKPTPPPTPPAPDDAVAAMVIEELATRIEALAARLEKSAGNA